MSKNWEALNRAIENAAYAERISTPTKIAQHLGIDVKTYRLLRNGKGVSPSTLRTIEVSLGWSPHDADTVLDGGPVPRSRETSTSGDRRSGRPDRRVAPARYSPEWFALLQEEVQGWKAGSERDRRLEDIEDAKRALNRIGDLGEGSPKSA